MYTATHLVPAIQRTVFTGLLSLCLFACMPGEEISSAEQSSTLCPGANPPAGKIYMCHATKSAKNPYVKALVSENSQHQHGVQHNNALNPDLVPGSGPSCECGVCQSDSDCGDGMSCEAGVCVEPSGPDCSTVLCADPSCAADETAVTPDGECCAVCEPVFCTSDAFQCPDGSYVSRDPSNNCEFSACPSGPDCSTVLCADPSCAADETAVTPDGECCAVCEPAAPIIVCGGLASLLCPDGLVCVDEPNDGCDPSVSSDCGGMCVPE